MSGTYSASLEPVCEHTSMLRVHPVPSGRYGDPYVWCSLVVHEGDTAST